MFQKVFFIKLLLVHFATQSQADVQADCYNNVSLACQAWDIDMNFVSVVWYKVDNQGRKTSLSRKNKNENFQMNYNFRRHTIFEKSYSLSLLGVMPNDSGIYECTINAAIGSKNLHSRVNLTVHECVTQPDLTPMTNVLNTTQQPYQVTDLPVTWSIIGCAAVGLAKIILSLISIWVIQAFRGRSSRRYQ